MYYSDALSTCTKLFYVLIAISAIIGGYVFYCFADEDKSGIGLIGLVSTIGLIAIIGTALCSVIPGCFESRKGILTMQYPTGNLYYIIEESEQSYKENVNELDECFVSVDGFKGNLGDTPYNIAWYATEEEAKAAMESLQAAEAASQNTAQTQVIPE